MSNPLDPIMDWRQVALDSFAVSARVATRRSSKSRSELVAETKFNNWTHEECRARIDEAKKHVDDLVVLALVATFERAIRDYLLNLPRLADHGGDDVDAAIRERFVDDLEYWRLADQILDMFRRLIDGKLRGQVKQAIEYRNWVAHGRSEANPSKRNVTPQFAYKVLSDFLRDAGVLA